MNPYHIMIILCVALFLLAAGTSGTAPLDTRSIIATGLVWGVPMVIGLFALLRARWVLMVGIIGGTIGLALDVSTLIHLSMEAELIFKNGIWVALSGLLNMLLIVVGGYGFMKMG